MKEGKEFNLGYAFESQEEKVIQELLVEYLDVFAWTHFDLKSRSRPDCTK